MEKEDKNTSYKWLAIGVAGVAVFAIGAYSWRFWAWYPSKDPENWANFATYLSGTVGVSAVVATLMAFIITLRQQQKLIDSQDQMLKEQKIQISQTKTQIIEEKDRRSIELAYDNVKNILPVMISSLDASVRQLIVPTEYMNAAIRDNFVEADIGVCERNELYANPNRLLHPALIRSVEDAEGMQNFIETIMRPCLRIYDFLFSQLAASPDLYKIVDCYLDERFHGGYHNAQFYMLCVMAYKSGVYDLGFCIKASKYMFVQTDFDDAEIHLRNWFRLGELIREAKRDG